MTTFPGVLHRYAPPLVAFEFSSASSQSSTVPESNLSTIIFCGGLFDNLLTVPFSYVVADNLPPDWRLMQATLSSSGIGWGTSNLDRDVSELSQLVSYLRQLRPSGHVVLLGHSTGSQDAMHYVAGSGAEDREKLDGVILQAPVSDREGMDGIIPADKLQPSVALAQEMIAAGRGGDLLPIDSLPDMPPLTASRWLSLASPGPEHAGQDDMFSSDLPNERLQNTFGKLGKSKIPCMLLYMGNDQHVPAFVDKSALVGKWIDIVKANGGSIHEKSGIVPGMDHNGSGASEEANVLLAQIIVAFVKSL